MKRWVIIKRVIQSEWENNYISRSTDVIELKKQRDNNNIFTFGTFENVLESLESCEI